MKLRVLALSACLMLPTVGCGIRATTPPAAVAPGYFDGDDQSIGEALAGANGFYGRLQADSATTPPKFVPSPAEVTALNALSNSLNIANPVYKAYHSGTATKAQAQAAVADVTAKQNALQGMIGATK